MSKMRQERLYVVHNTRIYNVVLVQLQLKAKPLARSAWKGMHQLEVEE